MLRPCFPWMLLMAGDLAALALPGPGPPPLPPPSPPSPTPLLIPLEVEELLRFLLSRRLSEEWWLKLVWWSDEDWRWTKGPRESVESLLFITTLMRLIDSAGLPEGGPREGGPEEPPAELPEGSALRLSELVRTMGPQFSPTLWTPLWEKDNDDEDDKPNELWW